MQQAIVGVVGPDRQQNAGNRGAMATGILGLPLVQGAVAGGALARLQHCRLQGHERHAHGGLAGQGIAQMVFRNVPCSPIQVQTLSA